MCIVYFLFIYLIIYFLLELLAVNFDVVIAGRAVNKVARLVHQYSGSRLRCLAGLFVSSSYFRIGIDLQRPNLNLYDTTVLRY